MFRTTSMRLVCRHPVVDTRQTDGLSVASRAHLGKPSTVFINLTGVEREIQWTKLISMLTQPQHRNRSEIRLRNA